MNTSEQMYRIKCRNFYARDCVPELTSKHAYTIYKASRMVAQVRAIKYRFTDIAGAEYWLVPE